MIRRSRRLGIAALLAAPLTLTACAAPIPTDAEWHPRTPESVSELAAAGEDIGFASIDPAELDGVTQHRTVSTDLGVDLRWPEVAGADGLNEAVEQHQWALIEQRESASGVAYAPQAQEAGAGLGPDARGCAPGATTASVEELRETATEADLVSTCEIVAAGGGMLGIRWRTLEGEDERLETSYYDALTGAEYGVADLLDLDDAAMDTLWHEAVQAMRVDAGALTLWPTGEPAVLDNAAREQFGAALAAGVLEPDGSLVLDVPGGFDSPELEALPGREDAAHHDRIRFAPDAIAPFLNDSGRSALELLGEDSPWQPPQSDVLGAHADCDLVACLALTYDDGPNPEMAGLLDSLAEHGAVATFFFIGSSVSGNADIVQRTQDEGHEVANHSWSHPDLTTLKPKEIREQIDRTQDAIAAITGVAPTLVRPPYGAFDDAVVGACDQPLVLWDVDTLDWEDPPVEELTADAVGTPEAGSIVLMHSIHDGSIEAAPGIVDGLHDRGFELVTVSGMFDGAVPGVVYSGR